MVTGIHSILCITPPHMLEQIAERGNTRQREWALRTLSTSEQFRGQRIAATSIRAMVQAAQAAEKERRVYDAQHGTTLPGQLARSEGIDATFSVVVLYVQLVGGEPPLQGKRLDLHNRILLDVLFIPAFAYGLLRTYVPKSPGRATDSRVPERSSWVMAMP